MSVHDTIGFIVSSLGQKIFDRNVRSDYKATPWKENGKKHIVCVRGKFFPESSPEVDFEILVVGDGGVSLTRVEMGG